MIITIIAKIDNVAEAIPTPRLSITAFTFLTVSFDETITVINNTHIIPVIQTEIFAPRNFFG